MSALPVFDGYALDLDGTVYLGDALLPGARDAVARLRATGARVVFATNKPLDTGAEYAKKLTRLGIATTPAEVVTAVDNLIHHLEHRHPRARVMLIAEETVEASVRAAGFAVVTDPAATDVLVVSFDRRFDYAKLHAAFRAVRDHGAVIVATNPDPFCPTPEGGLPDCAAMLAAVEACTGARAEVVLGKPSAEMAAALLDRLGIPAGRAAMVGDRLHTDVRMGQRVGAAGILVLSGVTTAAELAAGDITPDHVLDGIHQLIPEGATPP